MTRKMIETLAEKREAYIYSVKVRNSLGDFNEDRTEEWMAFSGDEQKKIREKRTFLSFARVSGVVSNSFACVNEEPPSPDIRSEIDGQPYYFELGEVTDKGLARAVGISEKTGEITGGPFSQSIPVLKMLRDKCTKSYSTGGAPVDLLLYYSKQYPSEKCLFRLLKDHQAEITLLIATSPFSRFWIYLDWPPGKVLWQAARYGGHS
jgi:hypothetical protein